MWQRFIWKIIQLLKTVAFINFFHLVYQLVKLICWIKFLSFFFFFLKQIYTPYLFVHVQNLWCINQTTQEIVMKGAHVRYVKFKITICMNLENSTKKNQNRNYFSNCLEFFKISPIKVAIDFSKSLKFCTSLVYFRPTNIWTTVIILKVKHHPPAGGISGTMTESSSRRTAGNQHRPIEILEVGAAGYQHPTANYRFNDQSDSMNYASSGRNCRELDKKVGKLKVLYRAYKINICYWSKFGIIVLIATWWSILIF